MSTLAIDSDRKSARRGFALMKHDSIPHPPLERYSATRAAIARSSLLHQLSRIRWAQRLLGQLH